jgi:hypothetical protein
MSETSNAQPGEFPVRVLPRPLPMSDVRKL